MQESRTITRKSASNLALAFVLLPREKRDGMSALYAFCREVDDVVDQVPDLCGGRRADVDTQPGAPARMVTVFDSLSRSASADTSPTEGLSKGSTRLMLALGLRKSAFFSAMSPGMATTETPCLASAVWIAISSTLGICSG